jgi:hypothetical protein
LAIILTIMRGLLETIGGVEIDGANEMSGENCHITVAVAG